MKILFPLICFAYAWIFYVFFQWWGGMIIHSIFPSLLYNTLFFILIALYFLFSFSNLRSNIFSSEKPKNISPPKNLSYYKEIFKDTFLSYSHYLSYIFFYLWVFIVVKFLPWIFFSYCLLFANIFVLLFFILFRNSRFSLDFLRVNQIIFSCIYIGSYVYILISGNNFFSFIDFLNSFLIIFSFLLCLKVCPPLARDSFFVWNFYLYLYSFVIFYTSYFFENKLVFLSVVNIVLSILVVTLAQIFQHLSLDRRKIRGIWIILGYIWAIIWAFYLIYYSESIVIYISLIIVLIHNFLFHQQYQNYVSYLLSVCLFSLLLFMPSFWNINGMYNFIFIFFFSYFLILFTYFFWNIHEYDSYFLHFLSYIYNFFGIIFFFVFYSPGLLEIALLMFLEFLYFFWSYHKLSREKVSLKNN